MLHIKGTGTGNIQRTGTGTDTIKEMETGMGTDKLKRTGTGTGTDTINRTGTGMDSAWTWKTWKTMEVCPSLPIYIYPIYIAYNSMMMMKSGCIDNDHRSDNPLYTRLYMRYLKVHIQIHIINDNNKYTNKQNDKIIQFIKIVGMIHD